MRTIDLIISKVGKTRQTKIMLTYCPIQHRWRKKRIVAALITGTMFSLYTYFRKIKTKKRNINKLYTTNEKPRSLKNFCFCIASICNQNTRTHARTHATHILNKHTVMTASDCGRKIEETHAKSITLTNICIRA
jgi:hypothetical protein